MAADLRPFDDIRSAPDLADLEVRLPGGSVVLARRSRDGTWRNRVTGQPMKVNPTGWRPRHAGE